LMLGRTLTPHVTRHPPNTQLPLPKFPTRRFLSLGSGQVDAQSDTTSLQPKSQKTKVPTLHMPKATPTPITAPTPRRFLPVLLLLFAASGCSALIYEIVWYQLLQFVIGSTAVSLGVLLATFMGGLCIGSILLPRIAQLRSRHPLQTFAFLELGIALCGILVPLLMPLVSHIYVAAVGHGMPSILLRALICAICLLPPTIFMGASLPAAARWLETSQEGVSWMGLLYGANTAGAVFGCLLASFYLLRKFDSTRASLAAAAINIAVALISLLLARLSPHTTPANPSPKSSADTPTNFPIYTAIALSGASALGAEVVWTRLLGLLLGGSVYVFSLILAVFLIGMGIGSLVGSLALRGTARPRIALGCCQLALAAAIAWTAWTLSDSLPYWPINPFLSTSIRYMFQLDLVRCLFAILPAALLWGASFPLALAASAPENESTNTPDLSRLAGHIYATNTGGAILGALAFSMVLIPWIGTRHSESVLIALCIVSALIVLWPLVWRGRSLAGAALLATSVCCAVVLATHVSDVPGELIAYGREIAISMNEAQILYTAEGIDSSIAITRWSDGAVQFHVSGKAEASTEPFDMRLQRMLGLLPSLILSQSNPAQPRSALVVGFGAGVTAGTFTLQPTMQRIVICEMEPLIPATTRKYFRAEQYDVLDDPRTHIVYDDARHFILTTPEKFDIITSDPIHPFVKGSAALYSKEYFEMVKARLNPGGVVTQWVPLYDSDLKTVKSEIATFFSVFPNGTIFTNEDNGGGYDLVLLGRDAPFNIDVDALQARLEQPAYQAVAQSLLDVGFHSAPHMLGTYVGQASDLQPWLADAEINRDANLRLQYLAGFALNDNQANAIYQTMLAYRRYPNNLFTVSPQLQPTLIEAFRTRGR
jgi:spermidine synthase